MYSSCFRKSRGDVYEVLAMQFLGEKSEIERREEVQDAASILLRLSMKS